MNRAWWGASFVSGSSLISWYGTIAIGALASTNPITGCLWGVGAGCAIVSLFIGKKYRLEQGELLKSKNEFLKEQISDLSEGLVLQFLQDVSEIEPGQEVHFFILLPREGLEELQRQLDGILFRHGFAQGLVVLSV